MRSYWNRAGPESNMTRVIRRSQVKTEDWSDAFMGQRRPRLPEARGGQGTDPPWYLQRKRSCADLLVLDFYSPELRENKCLLLKPPRLL